LQQTSHARRITAFSIFRFTTKRKQEDCGR
jgi:hypothetical protein